ncbi:MAG TPA: RsmE family RNA methyltransferase [Candidatus Acidoferrum sp.]|nr:RsmE family RNA methyltransferase [Candidatus Acidoferrum sp.]
MRRRFFVEQFSGTSAVMEGDAAHHLGHVLRAQTGQLYELSDGSSAWLARIESVARNRVEFALLEQLPAPLQTSEVTLLLSIVKFDAFEWAIEKATELGVTKIIPLAAARSEKGLLAAAAKRSQRWQKILLESSQQSRRLRIPQLDALAKPAQAFAAQSGDFRLILSERSDARSIRNSLARSNREKPDTAALATAALGIGPEGGWTDDEIAAARTAGFLEASLGQLILRTETAVIAALAALNFALSPD